jgi:hypothetical protein
MKRIAVLWWVFGTMMWGAAAMASDSPAPPTSSNTPDGQHDFDFAVGTWKTHVRRLLKPLSGSNEWVEGTGAVSTRKVWDGRAQLEELSMDAPGFHLEGLALRLYNPKTHQWRLHWANAKRGILSDAVAFGSFKNGRGEFYDAEVINGKNVFVREIFSDIKPDSHHFEQAFSEDQGKTWESNLIVDLTRTGAEAPVESLTANDRNRDFDFNYGHWKVRVSRLDGQLVGSTKWLEYDGVADVKPVWNGRGNLIEVEADGAAGHLEGLGLRLYDPESHQWNLNWAASRIGMMGTPPAIGGFKNGRGEFFDQELLDGRDIFVRNTYTDIRADGARFEQAFSGDAGQSWEKNWVITFAGKE